MIRAMYSVHRYAVFVYMVVAFTLFDESRGDVPQLSTSLGLPVELSDFYIPGGKAEPIPRMDRESSLVIRVLDIKPAADGFRYDLEIYGLDPGIYTLSDYFRYIGRNDSLPELSQEITITTAHELQGIPKPEELANKPPEKQGGYRLLLTVLVVIWAIVFLLILFWKKRKPQIAEESSPPPTLHEKLQVLVNSAARGELDDTDRSKLERLILGYWKQKLPEIENLSAAEALVALRKHTDASPLLLEIEQWLHAPNPSIDQQSVTTLLEPFRDA